MTTNNSGNNSNGPITVHPNGTVTTGGAVSTNGSTTTVPIPPIQWMTYSYVTPSYPVTQLDFDWDLEEPEKKSSNGCTCSKCLEMYPYAEMTIANTVNGKFMCWGCRHGF